MRTRGNGVSTGWEGGGVAWRGVHESRGGRWGRCCAVIVTLAVCIIGLLPLPGYAQNTFRNASTGSWFDANWTAGVPGPTTNAYIGYSGYPQIATVIVDNASAQCRAVNLAYGATANCTLIVTNGADLTCDYSLDIGGIGGVGRVLISDDSSVTVANRLQLGGTNSLVLTTNYNLSIPAYLITGTHNNNAGPTPVTQVGGSRTNASGLLLGYVGNNNVGIYNLLSNGTLRVGQLMMGRNGRGIVNAEAGTTLICNDLTIANGSSLVVDTNYSFTVEDRVDIGNGGYRHAADVGDASLIVDGTSFVGPSLITVAYNPGSANYTMHGRLVLTNGAVVSTPSFYVRTISNAVGTVRGSGTINVTGPTTFRMDGRVIADGFGTEQDLAITNMPAVTRGSGFGIVQPDGTLPGWYAVNGGRLRLESLVVGSGTSGHSWGESTAATTPELVNGVRLEFTGVGTGGTIDGALQAKDRADPLIGSPQTVIGVWRFESGGGFSFGGGSVTLTFRYDDALAASLGLGEAGLKVWQSSGGMWQEVAATVDTVADTITVPSLTSLGYFAVSTVNPAPPSGTLVLIR